MTISHQNQMRFFALMCLLITLYTSMNAQCDRLIMVQDYEKYFLGTQIPASNLAWDGDANNCFAGDISADARKKTLDRINYYRRLAKLPTEVGFDDSLTPMCQKAALMMHSNNQLSHDPDSSWSCFSADGKQAAGKSNLALGAHSSEAIALYMIDPGANNGPVGHRRWILYSRAKDFGMGSTNRAHALYVIHNKVPTPEGLKYIAYPGPGYFPAPLLPIRWSLSVPGADFTGAEVLLKDATGTDLDLEVLPVKNGFGDNTLVWEVNNDVINKFSEYDQTISVDVRNIRIGNLDTSFTYEVTVAPVNYPPVCPDGSQWVESDCSCQPQQTTSISGHGPEFLQISPNPADKSLSISIPEVKAGEQIRVTLIDLTGQTVLNQILPGTGELHVESLPAGFYTALIDKDHEHYFSKVIIRH